MVNTALHQLMQKHNCQTLEELAVKRQELQQQFLTTRSMVDDAIQRGDLEYTNNAGVHMDEFEAQVREIEDAMNAK